jgi:hypothetical protein
VVVGEEEEEEGGCEEVLEEDWFGGEGISSRTGAMVEWKE